MRLGSKYFEKFLGIRFFEIVFCVLCNQGKISKTGLLLALLRILPKLPNLPKLPK